MYRHIAQWFLQEKVKYDRKDDAMPQTPQLLTDLHAATMTATGTPYGMIENAAIALEGGLIAWVGPEAEVPSSYIGFAKHSMSGRIVTPGLIDCHTHIVHGGDRAVEFEMRLNGASYEEVARAGGGIVSTVTATRKARSGNGAYYCKRTSRRRTKKRVRKKK